MDRKIKKKYWTRKRWIYLATAVVIIALSIFGFRSINQKTYKLDQSRITVKEVKESDFQDMILIDAEVEPITSVLLNHPDGGTVQEVFIEDGVMVKKGTPLLKLSNPSVMLVYMTQETAIVEQINNLQTLKLSLDKDQRNLTESLIDIEYQLEDKERIFRLDTLLYDQDVIAKNQMDDTYGQYKYQQKKQAFLLENVAKTKIENDIQIKQINRSIKMMNRNLEVIHSNIDRMLIRAPVTGMLSSFDPVIGESFSQNQTIAKLDVLKGYKVKGLVDEYYLSTVKAGQAARFSFDDEMVDLKVKKVLPEVVSGRFEIELVFLSKAPKSIAAGQSLQIRLELSAASQAIIIPRGNFFHSFGGKYVFVMNENEESAEKRQIRIGRQNPSHYEVLDGLMKGEQIITSSYEAFKDYESVSIVR
ncbi:MAG: HlyD family secretion protein [Polaribacter sp.]|jgi:HlyD family secretion protein